MVETLAVVFLEDDSVFKKVVQAASGAAAAAAASADEPPPLQQFPASSANVRGSTFHCRWRVPPTRALGCRVRKRTRVVVHGKRRADAFYKRVRLPLLAAAVRRTLWPLQQPGGHARGRREGDCVQRPSAPRHCGRPRRCSLGRSQALWSRSRRDILGVTQVRAAPGGAFLKPPGVDLAPCLSGRSWTAKGTMSASHGGGAHHHCLWRGEVFARERVPSCDGAQQMRGGKSGRCCPRPCYSPRLAGARR